MRGERLLPGIGRGLALHCWRVGVVVVPGGREAPPADISELLASVDAVLHQAKSKGSGSVIPTIRLADHPAA